MKPFFIEIQYFWAWADNLGRWIVGHLGYFRPNYRSQHPFWYSESLVHYFYKKTEPLYPHPKYGIGIWIWAANNWGFSLRVSVVRVISYLTLVKPNFLDKVFFYMNQFSSLSVYIQLDESDEQILTRNFGFGVSISFTFILLVTPERKLIYEFT